MRITQHIRNHLTDFEILANDLHRRPTRLGEIVADCPRELGTVDACAKGMGGVLFTEDYDPVLWRATFPLDIQDNIVSSDNPSGDLTNSDLEQAGIIAQADIAAQEFDTREITVATLSDNTPAIGRSNRGATTTDRAAAYLCRPASFHQRHYRYHHEVSFINGHLNELADGLSRW